MTEQQQQPTRILLVEDNPGDARLLREMLRDAALGHFALDHVDRLASAFDYLQTHQPDLVLLDLSLPDARGLETFQRLCRQAPDVPTVVMTGLNDDTLAAAAIREGAQDYLVKGSVDANLLARSIRYAIERKRADKAMRDSEERATRLAEENAVLASIGRIISSSLDLDQVYARFAGEVQRLIEFDRITINTVDLDAQLFRVAYLAGQAVPERRIGDPVPLKGSFTEQVMLSRKGMIVQGNDSTEIATRLPGLIPMLNFGFRSFLSVPLMSHEVMIGVLHFRALSIDAYDAHDLELAEAVADQIAGAVASANLHAERIKAQEALKESERRYRQLIEGASDVVFTTDVNGLFTYVNPPSTKLTEYSEEELIGMHFTALAAPSCKYRVERFYNRQYAKRQLETVLEFPIVTKYGGVKWVEQAVSLLINDGQVIGFQAIGRDITRRKEVEKERERLIAELRNALAKIKTLSGLLPICASCKKVRDDKGYWNQIETYISDHSDADFSHGICPDCFKALYGNIYEKPAAPAD